MSHNQTPNKKKLSSLLDELRTTALDLNTNFPSTRSVHDTYRENVKIIASLRKIIRLHPEFTNLSEPGKSHADFLVKWEMIGKYTRTLGHEWYWVDRTLTTKRDPFAKNTRELFAKEGREIRVWFEVIQNVQIKGFGGKGKGFGGEGKGSGGEGKGSGGEGKEEVVKTRTMTIPARERP